MTADEGKKGTELVHLTYDGNFQLETDATVLACRVVDDGGSGSGDDDADGKAVVRVELELDVTTMHPQGGGQPTDVGTIVALTEGGEETASYSAAIDKVTLDRATGIVTHAGAVSLPSGSSDAESPLLDAADLFPVGSRVNVRVDEAHRALLSECHTAGHVVDAAMARCERTLPPVKGYHFLQGPYVEYRGAIDAKEREGFLERLKAAFQELVDEDAPTAIQTLPVDDAEALCNRLAQNFDVMNFVSPEDPNPSVRVVTTAGCTSPCGGTHVRSAGALKGRGWAVKGLKCKKGVVRVRYGPEG